MTQTSWNAGPVVGWQFSATSSEISRQCGGDLRLLRHQQAVLYGWLRRFEADGLDGLKGPLAAGPHHSPLATRPK
jgi:hypothetical protein